MPRHDMPIAADILTARANTDYIMRDYPIYRRLPSAPLQRAAMTMAVVLHVSVAKYNIVQHRGEYP